MGKKYTIELERGETAYKTVDSNGTPLIQLLAPTPYTEPDLEQVRKEAYEKGRKDVETQFCSYDACKNRQEEYQRGLADAWETARTLWNTPNRKEIFGNTTFNTVLTTHTAQETIEKIRQYEQEKEEQITKGDIVLIKSTPEIEILVTFADEEYVSGIALTEVYDNCEIGDQYTNIRISNVEKTGKHYDIVSVLQKMREESNG